MAIVNGLLNDTEPLSSVERVESDGENVDWGMLSTLSTSDSITTILKAYMDSPNEQPVKCLEGRVNQVANKELLSWWRREVCEERRLTMIEK